MADAQIQLPNVGALPKDWVVPGALSILLKCVQADFDGSGAASAFLPTVEIVSDAGLVVGRAFTDASVAAGGSASVTFAPFLKQAAAAATASSLPSATIDVVVDPFANTGFNLTQLNMDSASFFTNDATVFEVGTTGGKTGIRAKTVGQYQVWASVLGDLTSPPAAGSFIQVFTTSVGGEPFDESRFGTWLDIDGFGDYEAAATRGWMAVLSNPSAPPPFVFTVRVGQNSGSAIQIHAYLQIVRTSPTPFF